MHEGWWGPGGDRAPMCAVRMPLEIVCHPCTRAHASRPGTHHHCCTSCAWNDPLSIDCQHDATAWLEASAFFPPLGRNLNLVGIAAASLACCTLLLHTTRPLALLCHPRKHWQKRPRQPSRRGAVAAQIMRSYGLTRGAQLASAGTKDCPARQPVFLRSTWKAPVRLLCQTAPPLHLSSAIPANSDDLIPRRLHRVQGFDMQRARARAQRSARALQPVRRLATTRQFDRRFLTSLRQPEARHSDQQPAQPRTRCDRTGSTCAAIWLDWARVHADYPFNMPVGASYATSSPASLFNALKHVCRVGRWQTSPASARRHTTSSFRRGRRR